jgi:hypothetical protein
LIAAPRQGYDESWVARIITERPPEHGYPMSKAIVSDEGVGPSRSDERILVHDLILVAQKADQQIEHTRR